MAQRREVVLVCDLCDTQDMVETHRVTVDGVALDAEACISCWGGFMASFGTWARVGRSPQLKKSKAKDMVSWPDSPWRFTAHALERMGKRKMSPKEIFAVIAEPEIRRPGEAGNEEVWTRNGIKVVVVPDQQVIVTVAKMGVDDDVAA